ncbi:MAG: alpha/beta hydrolase [Hyphomicrobiales bacterium]|nr:alpha/beta hydrolase [Hyphomicrobiales bacterium]
MPNPPTVDPFDFSDEAIAEDVRRLNAEILDKMKGLPDQWSFPLELVRERRRQGLGPFPLAPKSERAEILEIDGPAGPLALRLFVPDEPVGVYLHIHGGGWVLGGTDEQDPRLQQIADHAGYAVVSVDYRLAPESPYPAAPDDCEAAALWLVENGRDRFGTTRFAIGGESAGAQLAVVTLLRLRDRHGLKPFAGAALTAGVFDLGLTPSAANWGEEKLILNTRDIRKFVENFLAGGGSVSDPDISPLYADLRSLPPALFAVGTRDPLRDDSLFMSALWAAAGNSAELAVTPGGCHVFENFPGPAAEKSLARLDRFLADLTEGASA